MPPKKPPGPAKPSAPQTSKTLRPAQPPPPSAPSTPSPASTLPMFRDKLDEEIDSAATLSEAADVRRRVLMPESPPPMFGNSRSLRPPAVIVDPLAPPAPEDDPITKLAEHFAKSEHTERRKPEPRVTRIGPIARGSLDKVELVTQIGPVTKVELVPRSQLEARAEPGGASDFRAEPTRRTAAPVAAPQATSSSSAASDFRPEPSRRATPVPAPAPQPTSSSSAASEFRAEPTRRSTVPAAPSSAASDFRPEPTRREPVRRAESSASPADPASPIDFTEPVESAPSEPARPELADPGPVSRTEPASWGGRAILAEPAVKGWPQPAATDRTDRKPRGEPGDRTDRTDRNTRNERLDRNPPGEPGDRTDRNTRNERLDRNPRGEPGDRAARGEPGDRAARKPARPVERPLGASKKRSAGESLARLFYFVSGTLLAAAIAMYGGRFWRQNHETPITPPPTPTATPIPAAVIAAAGGRVELTADHRGVSRITSGAQRWGAPLPTALDALELTGPLVIGHAADTIVALDLESGRTRFTWAPPKDEHWGSQRPIAIDSCLVAITTHDHKTAVHCLDLETGAVRWSAALPGDHDCTQLPVGVPSAVLVPCSGWTAVIDDHSGAVSPMSSVIGVVQSQPPTLLRTGPHLVTMPWSEAKHRFTQTGDIQYGGAGIAASSAVLHKDRLVLRAVDSSDDLAVIVPREGDQTLVTAPAYRLADAMPLVASCGGDTSPRFQLLELTPRIGASFDPATAGDRALALLDVESGALAWTSHKVTGLHGTHAAAPPICRGGHYFVPIELTDRAGKPTSALWIVDAETGKTAAAIAFDPELGAAMSELTTDQIDGDRLVGVGAKGAFELAWLPPAHGLHDARGELEGVLGTLP